MSKFNLNKDDKFNLSKDSDQLKIIRAEMGWNTPENTLPAYDLDVSLFGLRSTNNGPKLINEDYFVFYNHDATSDGAITKSPDELSGGVEWIKIELPKVNPKVDELAFVVTIHKAKQRHQSFNQVKDSYIEIFNDETNEAMCRFQLDKYGSETAIQVGSLIREGDEWIFEAVGAGYQAELADIVKEYDE